MKTPVSKSSNQIKDIKYPFHGIAPNLIDKFLVLGYDQKTIDFTFQNCNVEPNETLKTRFIFYEFEERPNVVNEICNDYSKDLLDNDLILELIFPNYPQMYFLEKELINSKKELDEEIITSPYSIIFSINPQDNYGSKKSYNGLGYIFYILHEHKSNGVIDGYLYIPTAYVILSEYPYFYKFNEICKNIFIQIKRESDEIPFDIIIYNTIKFLPSPINKSINLYFGNEINYKQKNSNDIEEILYKYNSKHIKDKSAIPSMFFSQLSGYPIIDINMSFIFNLIPPEIIIEVFIFSFLEHDIIFYSSKPELLNMIMYIFSCFNYPFNDSIYYWHILSVSQESFMSGTSTFVGKTSSTITGILSEYDPEVLTTKKIKEHFVLDIDNKNFFFLYQEDNQEVKDTMALYTYIKNCAESIINFNPEDKKKVEDQNYFIDGIHLYDCIKDLIEELNRRSKKVTSIDYNLEREKPNFFNFYRDESEKLCIESNKRLQRAFLIFIINIIKNFMECMNPKKETIKKDENNKIINDSSPDNSRNVQISEEERSKIQLAEKAGAIFREKFMDSSKYNSFVINFCKYHETIDMYKIPYIFINEFIYYSQFEKNLNEVYIFNIIDQFYGKLKLLDFEELSNKKQREDELSKKKKIEKGKVKENTTKEKNFKEILEKKITQEEELKIMEINKEKEQLQNIYLFSFDNFSDYYKEKLRAIINREQEDDKENFTKVKSVNRVYKKYKRNNYFLSQKILNIYITIINNNLKDIIKTFNLIKCEDSAKDSEENQPININNSKMPKNKEKEGDLSKKKGLGKEVKNEIIDYFYLFENKFNKDNTLKEKLFGTYDMVDISNIVEYNFFMEKTFSSYALIKYSLLNVLAVTRIFESKIINNQNIIQIICDFCDITKLPVKKYMNIYLNIFKAFYQTQNENFIKKFKIEECLNIILSNFQKYNMISKEEREKLSNDLKINSTEISSIQETKDFKDYIQEYGKLFKIKKNLFSSGANIKIYDNALKIIESIHLGKYENNIFDFEIGLLEDLFKLNKTNIKKKKFIPKTPILLYNSTNKILKKYLIDFSIENDLYIELYDDILSLLFYFKMPNIGNKWIEISEEKNKKKKVKVQKIEEKKNKSDKKKNDEDKKKNSKSNKKRKNESKSSSINDSQRNWEEFEFEEKEEKSDSKDIKSETKEDVNALNEMLKKIIVILFDLISHIKEKLYFQYQ